MKRKINAVASGRFMPWEDGPFRRSQQISHQFPLGFVLLCRLTNTTPENIMADVADNLSFGSWKRKGRDVAKEKLLDYFIAHGYGQETYSPQEILEMTADLNALGRLFPSGDPKLVRAYETWREEYYHYWFNKWKK